VRDNLGVRLGDQKSKEMVMKAIVIQIPRWARRLLALMPRWKETWLTPNTQIARHSHDFMAVYFAFGVGHLEEHDGIRALPEAAMVIVPAGVAHGWVSCAATSRGTIGHFHPGHPAHHIHSTVDAV